MSGVVSVLQAIGNSIVSLVDFVISFFGDLIYMIQLLGKIVLQIPIYFSWLPPEILAMVVLIFAIVVIYKILGREG